ncbi:MAG TPA: hypothetical protein VHZ03_31145 [Trebonia sp.]|jgi:hypothetical protein|nr:hypothetical protein [Trebonia sp.]
MLPSEVAGLLRGEAAEDAWEPVFLLLTVSSDGYAQVCQLSRAEIEVGQGQHGADVIRGVIRARRTIANLHRDGRGLLVVVGGQSAYYLRLRTATVLEEDGGRTLAVAFAVDGAEDDTLGIPLRPMMFQSSSYVRDRERWDDNRALLGRLADTESTGNSEGSR